MVLATLTATLGPTTRLIERAGAGREIEQQLVWKLRQELAPRGSDPLGVCTGRPEQTGLLPPDEGCASEHHEIGIGEQVPGMGDPRMDPVEQWRYQTVRRTPTANEPFEQRPWIVLVNYGEPAWRQACEQMLLPQADEVVAWDENGAGIGNLFTIE